MFQRLFIDHPRSVDESYAEHFGVALRFGVMMIVGGLGAIVHAIVPALFKDAGSRMVLMLHGELVAKRGAKRDARSIEWMI